MSPSMTNEMGQPDRGHSNDIGIPVESQRESTVLNCCTAKDTYNALFCLCVP